MISNKGTSERIIEVRVEMAVGYTSPPTDALCQMTGETVSIDFRLFQADEMSNYLKAAGFEETKIVERAPYEFEYPTKRIYAFASKA